MLVVLSSWIKSFGFLSPKAHNTYMIIN